MERAPEGTPQSAVRSMMSEMLHAGMPPAQVAQHVFDAMVFTAFPGSGDRHGSRRYRGRQRGEGNLAEF